MSWHKEFLEATKEAEAPETYFYWSGLLAIASVVSNRVYVHKKFFKVFPNLFVFLVSKNSGLGKGVPVNECKEVLKEVGTCRLIVGQNSIEGIIDLLSNAYTTKNGKIITTAEATLLAGEFGSFLLENPKLFTNLTDLYDSQYNQGEWDKNLVSRAKATLKDICINGLFAANETHFKEALPLHAIKGGFLGRTICVYESKRRGLNPLIKIEGVNEAEFIIDEKIRKELAKHLIALAKVQGEFIFTKEAGLLYTNWYREFYNLDKEFRDDTGTAERLRDTIIKVSMLLCLADGTCLKIQKVHVEEAMIRCYQIYTSTMKMIMGEGKSETAPVNKIIIRLLLECKGDKVKRQDILIRGLQTGDFNHVDLDKTAELLMQARIISLELGHGGPWFVINRNNINEFLKLGK